LSVNPILLPLQLPILGLVFTKCYGWFCNYYVGNGALITRSDFKSEADLDPLYSDKDCMKFVKLRRNLLQVPKKFVTSF
jgi:hypothetical protein